MGSNIPPRLRRNRMIANLEYILNEKLEHYCFITPKFIVQEYDDVAENFTLKEELDFFDTTIFDLLEKNFPNTYILYRDGDEPGFLRKALINQPLQVIANSRSGAMAIEPPAKQIAIEYGEVDEPDIQKQQQITPASTISRFLEEEVEPNAQKTASVSDADSAYSSPESDPQHMWPLVDVGATEKTDDLETSFCWQRIEADRNLAEEYECERFSTKEAPQMANGIYDELQTERSVCPPPPGYEEQPVWWPLYTRHCTPVDMILKHEVFENEVTYTRKTKVKSPDITRQEISLEWSKNANSVPSAQVKFLSVKIPSAPQPKQAVKDQADFNVEERVGNSAKLPLYLELLVGVPPPGYDAAAHKELYSSMARKPKEGAEFELAKLLDQLSDAKEEVKRTVRNAAESLSENSEGKSCRPNSESVTSSRSSLDSGTSKSSSNSASSSPAGQLSQDVPNDRSKNEQKDYNEGYFCEPDFECDQEPVIAAVRSVYNSPVKSSLMQTLANRKLKIIGRSPNAEEVCKPICYSLRGDLIQNYEAASEYRLKLVRNSMSEGVECIVQDWVDTIPNLNAVVRALQKLREQHPNGFTPLQVCMFEQSLRKQSKDLDLFNILPPFPLLLEQGLLVVSKRVLAVAKQVGLPNFICLRKNFVSNLYRLLLSHGGFAKVEDLIPCLKGLAPKNYLIKKENILNICNRLPLVFVLEAYKGLDGYRYEHAVIRLNPEIPDWRIVLDCDQNMCDCQLCDCAGCRLIS